MARGRDNPASKAASAAAEAPPPSDPPRRLTHVGRGPVTYTDEGEGPAVVLLHGLPGSARDWRYLAPRLAGCRVIRIDLPGYGGTSRLGRRVWSVPQRAELVLAVLDELRVGPALVAGHSMGGPVAVAVATLAPRRITGVALVASPGLTPHRFFAQSRVAQLSRALRWPGVGLALRRPIRRGFVRAGFPRSTPDSELAAAIADAGALAFPAHAARVRSLQQPALVAYARDDRLVEAAIGDALAAEAPAGPRLVWPTGGHNVQKTRADELGAALATWAHERTGAQAAAGSKA